MEWTIHTPHETWLKPCPLCRDRWVPQGVFACPSCSMRLPAMRPGDTLRRLEEARRALRDGDEGAL